MTLLQALAAATFTAPTPCRPPRRNPAPVAYDGAGAQPAPHKLGEYLDAASGVVPGGDVGPGELVDHRG